MKEAEVPIQVPDKERLSAVQALCEQSDPYNWTRGVEILFVEAMRQNISWHIEKCSFYSRLAESKNFSPGMLKSMDDMDKVPFIHANFFKTHEVLSIDRSEVAVHLTSSGTTGQKSQIFFDAWSIGSARRMVDFIHDYYGLRTDQSVNYVLNSYEPEPDMNLGTANTMKFLTSYAPAKRIAFALRSKGKGQHEFDAFGVVDALRLYSQEELPVRIIGFPAFLLFTLNRLQEMNIGPMKLNPDSLVFLAGGWKGHAKQEVTKTVLYKLITEMLGIPDERIRSSFGSVEHSIPYIECAHHNLHIPVWSKVFIRDFKTLEVVGYGKPGFLQFVSPYITSVPAQGVMMGDMARLWPASSCPCGLKNDFFEILGRAGTSANKSCAAAAAELMKG
jgi:phenylacetate-coenzyme A ligase PaaK-like adenylate-forming protein